MSISFNLNTSTTKTFGPRLGSISLRRTQITLTTPTFITTTSRGIVPHLSQGNLSRTSAVKWVNVPFESFLEHNPPIPTLHPPSSKGALLSFLGFDSRKHIVSLSARDPADEREMPPNGNAVVSVWTLRGVRKLTPSDWRTYTLKCQPDIVFALSDTPFTDPVNHAYSQKRLTKSIDRTAAWLAVMLRPWLPTDETEKAKKKCETANSPPALLSSPSPPPPLPSVFLPMAGGSSAAARRAFASSLLEPFYGPEAEVMKQRGLKTLDDGVAGYSFDLASLKGKSATPESIEADASLPPSRPISIPTLPSTDVDLIPLIQTSLSPLLPTKPRLINCTNGPHEILRYITQVGVDVFDAAWAQHLAGWGVGLDFEFPIRESQRERSRSIGHNLYDQTYAFDFGTIADAFRGATPAYEDDNRPICACAACSPLSCLEQDQIRHGVDSAEYTLVPEQTCPTMQKKKHHTRAYIHHLLHTHEMGAHALLAMHNLTVLDRFFEGIQKVLGEVYSSSGGGEDDDESKMKRWTWEVERFCQTYSEAKSEEMVEVARRDWKNVDRARGKGRLAREKKNGEEAEILN